MKRRSILGILAIGVLLFASCKREDSQFIDQQRIYSSYEYTFDAERNESTMWATFRVDNSGGTKIELTYPARVEFNGEGLAWRNMSGRYELTRSGAHLNGAFTYHDLEESSFVNNVSATAGIELPFGLTNISRGGNFFLPWQGAPIQAGETVRVTISGGAQSSSRSFTETLVGATHIILDQSQLSGLTVGSAQIQIEREITTSLLQSNLAGGRITSRYRSTKWNINIVD